MPYQYSNQFFGLVSIEILCNFTCTWAIFEHFIYFLFFPVKTETLRKYPVVPGLNRRCTKEYTLPGTNIVLPVGTNIGIPTISLHNDPKYYPNPKRFDPERFSAANKSGKTFNDMPYLPFGDGPRNCIGMRMGKLFTKAGVAIILQKFRIELDVARHTENELTFAKDTIIPMAVGGINLKIQHRM